MAEADRVRYDTEIEEWRANDKEFYTKSDGKKSNAA